ncbi:DNA-binding transcriptional regulator, MarR family [Caloramator fervidus]|uniref:DNA-binding transcriptional regulator, MarR family n=1 Tax=Caloramator fervidus TaxID=29344 RepID=A0A1H5TLY8_9CLOT|nr:MarR family transcriptional regulator [Caloramator fervidus]SEF63779.1 DNA-binding transcriptional regulator, MarR family [Caloramator fervidus]
MREIIAEDLLTFLPAFYKKLMKGISITGISKQQLWLLHLVENYDEKPMSYYSEKMMIPKSNLTSISEKLIQDGLIERVFDPKDRRVILLKITEKGRAFLKECKQKSKQDILKKLEVLDENDIKKLGQLFDELKIIFNKLD